MIKTLLGKQMSEIYRGYFFDAKKNKKRSKGSSIAFFLLFAFLMVGLLGGLFAFLSIAICPRLIDVGMDWLYFSLMGLLAIFFGVFGSVFNTYAGLYLAKDNDLLLSMPIPVGAILVARLLGVYLMGLMYAGVVLIPAVIVYWVYASLSVGVILGSLLLIVLISVFVLTLSVALGFVVAKASKKLKNKSFVTVAISLVFIAAYYYLYSRAQDLISQLVANAAVWGDRIKQAAYPVYLFGRVATGDPIAILTVTPVILVLFFIMCLVIGRSFLSIATSVSDSGTNKAYRKGMTEKRESVHAALFKKELRRFTSNPTYMLNCGLGIVLMPVGAVALLVRGKAFLEMAEGMFGSQSGMIPVILTAAVCLLAVMNDCAAPSVSLEGKSIWLLQSLPVTPWQVLRAKLSLQLVLTWIPMAVSLAIIAFVVPLAPAELVMMILLPLLFVLLSSLFDLVLGLKLANLTWTNEITPIKQGGAVILSLFAGMVYPCLYGAGYLFFGHLAGMPLYTAAFAVPTVGGCAVLYLWLKKRGTKLFASL